MTAVKICGLMTVAAVTAAAKAGADYIGFVLTPSKRQVSLAQAANLRKMAGNAKVVGVFLEPTAVFIQEAIAVIGLDFVQIHGALPSDLLLERPLIKARSLMEPPVSNAVYAELIDAPTPGSGKVVDWSAITAGAHPLWLAGGLTAANVSEAIRIVKPAVVDVSSGVETNGSKDSNKIIQFITTVQQLTKEEQ
ncbi:phosphoribosylanthranilate isomerase [Brochothrix campestris]|uniref:N-(5'-phosphoribosyl)anthranilate isomerase n=1 Tax=Brochothrix campestris FSL F6-1037 TaxID=1265861 RepID=W7D1G2_9LIST|nr:phosphoribosylanthranilate isomerase [Brochothrix campestris]EUJ39183.1 N-(5'-phosphoribosyl)anthranilate isomerase [Brochothrix campestris FSL F6-1037]